MNKYSFKEIINTDVQGYIIYTENKSIEGYFTNLRVDRKTLPDGWLSYEIRGGDDEDFCSLEKSVYANHTGTFLCKEEIPLTPSEYSDYFELTNENWTFDDDVFDNPDLDINEWLDEKEY